MLRDPEDVGRTYIEEVVQKGHLELIDELARPDMVDEANQAFGGPPGSQGLVEHVVGFRRNVGNLVATVERTVANENESMVWWSFTGTHDGPWLGKEPTGEPISGTAFSFFELEEGLISRYRVWLHARLAEPVVFDSSRPLALP